MSKEVDFLDEVKSSLRETSRDITSEDIQPGAEVHHFKKLKNVINLVIWEAGDKIETLRNKLKEKKFEKEVDGIHFPFMPLKSEIIDEDDLKELEKAVSIVLIGMDILKKEVGKTIDFFEFYKTQMWVKESVTVDKNTQ